MMCNYLQTKNKQLMADFLKEVPDDCIVEITVHGKEKKHTVPHAFIYINDELVYDLDFVNAKYRNFKRFQGDGDFYLTPAEAFALNMYICRGLFETIEPHWWPYAERNIARHADALKELKDAKEQGKKIVLTFD